MPHIHLKVVQYWMSAIVEKKKKKRETKHATYAVCLNYNRETVSLEN